MLVLRTFPELVWRSVQNLVEIGPAVRAWKGDIRTWIQTITFIYIDKQRYFPRYLDQLACWHPPGCGPVYPYQTTYFNQTDVKFFLPITLIWTPIQTFTDSYLGLMFSWAKPTPFHFKKQFLCLWTLWQIGLKPFCKVLQSLEKIFRQSGHKKVSFLHTKTMEENKWVNLLV